MNLNLVRSDVQYAAKQIAMAKHHYSSYEGLRMADDCVQRAIDALNRVDGAITASCDDTDASIQEEREACARIADDVAWTNKNTQLLGPEMNSVKIAEAIRSRNKEVKQ